MKEATWMQTIKVEGGQLIDQVNKLIREGNVRRVSIKHEDQTVIEFPLTIGVVGAVLAPQLAAVGAIAALLTRCTVEVERVGDQPVSPPVAEIAAPDSTPSEETAPAGAKEPAAIA